MKVPRERVMIRFARSGGPGGQNVNKVETKAEVRFVLSEAEWIPWEVRERLAGMLGSSLTREGELLVTSSRHRSQSQNLEECFQKIEKLLSAAGKKPKKRVPTRPTKGSRQRKARSKKQRSQRKAERRWREE